MICRGHARSDIVTPDVVDAKKDMDADYCQLIDESDSPLTVCSQNHSKTTNQQAIDSNIWERINTDAEPAC
jgi:hypothetical protein